MYSLPIALIMAQGAQDARSALPGAPVVYQVDTVPVTQRLRRAVSGGLRQLADVVAPPRSVRHTPAPSGGVQGGRLT